MRQDAKVQRLAGIALFADASSQQLENIAQLCTQVSVPEGEVLCRQGDPGREFFVLVEGSAVVTVDGAQVATLSDGEFFGELALLEGGSARNATVTAASPAQLLVLTSAEFSGLLDSEPSVAVRMLPAIGRRLRRTAGAEPDHPVV